MKEYKKTYLPLIAWSLALVPAMLGSAELAERAGMDERGIIALMMTVVSLMVALLMWIIRQGGYVYWINGGPTFEEAKDAGEAVRRKYADRHFVVMLRGSFAVAVLMAGEYLTGAHEIVMVLSAAVCIIAATLKTIPIRWPEDKKHDPKN